MKTVIHIMGILTLPILIILTACPVDGGVGNKLTVKKYDLTDH